MYAASTMHAVAKELQAIWANEPVEVRNERLNAVLQDATGDLGRAVASLALDDGTASVIEGLAAIRGDFARYVVQIELVNRRDAGTPDARREAIALLGQIEAKSGEIERLARSPKALGEILAEHFASPAVQSSGLAFPGPKGAPLRRSNFRRVWTKARTRAGFDGGPLDGLVFHELRHTAAALAIAQGAHPVAIKERLGHSSITVTMDVYGGVFPRLEEAIAEGLDVVLRESLAGPARDTGGTLAHLRRSEG